VKQPRLLSKKAIAPQHKGANIVNRSALKRGRLGRKLRELLGCKSTHGSGARIPDPEMLSLTLN
jgi:hypothetical protein